MNEATREKRRNLGAAVAEYERTRFTNTDKGRKVALQQISKKYGVTQKAILEGAAAGGA